MAICELKYFSKSLEKMIAANLILPNPDIPGPFAVFYLLHGLSDDHTAWMRRTNIERYVEGLPLIVVMPDTGRGWYTDEAAGMAWESSIIKDLLPYIDKMFPTRANREGRCIGGLSMGGYGAVKLALKFPDLFCSGVSHSGALGRGHDTIPQDGTEWNVFMTRVFGPNPQGGENDIFALAEKLEPSNRPAIRIDCGVDDFLLWDNQQCHKHLLAIGYEHEYAEFPGEHNWAYWDIHVQEAIAFHCKNLGITPTK